VLGALQDDAAGLVLAGDLESAVQERPDSTIREGSIPQDAATISLGRQSSMRDASSLAANPPNTTEWTAPSRAQAIIAMTASGTIGM
jgi:hypothetical protein